LYSTLRSSWLIIHNDPTTFHSMICVATFYSNETVNSDAAGAAAGIWGGDWRKLSKELHVLAVCWTEPWQALHECLLANKQHRRLSAATSGQLHRVVRSMLTDVSGEPFIRLMSDDPDDGGSKRFWNVGGRLPDYTDQHSIRQPHTSTAVLFLCLCYCRPNDTKSENQQFQV
jgi:hypothetical protein